jgi:hypothetical protein
MAQLLDQLEHLSGTLRHIVARVILYDNLNAVLACGADHPFGFGVDISSLRQGRAAVLLVPIT